MTGRAVRWARFVALGAATGTLGIALGAHTVQQRTVRALRGTVARADAERVATLAGSAADRSVAERDESLLAVSGPALLSGVRVPALVELDLPGSQAATTQALHQARQWMSASDAGQLALGRGWLAAADPANGPADPAVALLGDLAARSVPAGVGLGVATAVERASRVLLAAATGWGSADPSGGNPGSRVAVATDARAGALAAFTEAGVLRASRTAGLGNPPAVVVLVAAPGPVAVATQRLTAALIDAATASGLPVVLASPDATGPLADPRAFVAGPGAGMGAVAAGPVAGAGGAVLVGEAVAAALQGRRAALVLTPGEDLASGLRAVAGSPTVAASSGAAAAAR